METYEVRTADNGIKEWYQNGKLHRVEWPSGEIEWYQDDKRHRLDGPAIEYPDGNKYYYQDGRLHRLDGPAVDCTNGHKEWWIKGEEYTEYEFLLRMKKPRLGEKVVYDGVEYTLS